MKRKQSILLLIGIILTGAVLRGPIASVGSMIGLIGQDIHVTTGALGFITTVPLLVFAVSSLLVPRLARKFGLTLTLLVGSVILLAGASLRGIDGYFVLLGGTLLLGFGISIGNVLLPAIIKERAPERIGLYTGSYLGMQNLSAGFGAAFSYPIALSVGWRFSISIWVVPILLATIMWTIYRRSTAEATYKEPVAKVDANLYKSRLAWYITIVMGLQSLCYYCITAWLPAIFEANSLSAQTAGYMASLFQIIAMPAIIFTPMIVAKVERKYLAIVFSGACYAIGAAILIFFHSIPMMVISLTFLAFGGGSSFSWVVAMIALVSNGGPEASRLSGMVQSLGYLIAAIGPTLSGAIYDFTLSWNWVLILVGASALAMIFFGLLTRGKNHL